MAQLTRAAWDKYVRKLGRIDQRAGQLMADYIQKVGTEDTQRLIQFAVALVNKYGAASSTLAAQFYDEMAKASGLTLPAAEPAEVCSTGEVAKAINGNRNSPKIMQSVVERMVKQAGADTTLKNALRDGAEFAWVPNGDTCAFCITLASRGWQKASKKAIKGGHAEHIHAHCDCNYCIRFNAKTTVEGYDPDSYLQMYESAEGGTPQEKINAMRRQAYAANKGLASEKKAGTIPLGNNQYTIAEAKLSGFLLKSGAKHSAEFFDAGYSEQDAMKLNADIYEQFDEARKTDVRTSKDGAEDFSIFMQLGVNKEKTFRTVWRRDPGSAKPRLITAHREELKDDTTL